ncbi:CDP-alcohol phosphatidyltransferase family protein [Flavobacterium reichenbachii]|uniref:CDP-alcohol phosphatidyltransferase n=1 Tax=Flavobacterium reichenbachii TaxID=362418 RepID=A0A085ZKY0_9FLAO|nr:CDP-alcohol phosphatidyltransferase family protein [Flavobacterium reichenbachii]KFF05094.1 CDP-alcohol phosphatidyltransferase [Flavobacterium reichenbachii]OXB16236.1 CDP-alcohol phosphatidyltransferase [Flavobacterium reichenbachii]
MISIYTIKPQFQKLLSPLLHFLHKKNISPNQITVGSCVLSLLIGISFWYADFNTLFFLLLPIGLLLRMALNALDGMMAKKYNLTSKTGEMLNEMGDIVSDLFVFFPLLKFESEALYLVVLFIVLSVVNEFAGVMGKAIKGERRYDGPMGKSDRALLLGVYGILKFSSVNLSNYSIWIFTVIIVLLLISTYVRIKKTLKS